MFNKPIMLEGNREVTFREFRPLETTKKLPDFPIECLPEKIGRYVKAVANSIQVYPDMPAALSLAVLSLCLQKKAVIAFNETWMEEINLYLCLIADPAERKSPVYRAMMSPIESYVREYNNRNASYIQSYNETKSALEAKKARFIHQGKDIEDINKINDEINKLVPKSHLKLTTSDATAEALAEKMAANNERMGIMADEGGIFDVAGGIYSGIANIAIYLCSYDGQPFNIDRKNGSVYLERPLLTFGVCAQPCVLNDILHNSTFVGRGFVQRFLFCLPKSLIGSRELSNKYEDEFIRAREEYKDLIYKLMDIPETDRLSSIIRLSPAASLRFTCFYNKIERALDRGGAFEFNRDYFGKFAGRTLRIAALLHMAEYQNTSILLSRDTMEKAINIATFFIKHSQSIFDINDDCVSADMVISKIKNRAEKHNVNVVSYRDIRRLVGKKLNVNQLDEAIELLVDRGYLAEIPIERTAYNGRKKPDYMISMNIF